MATYVGAQVTCGCQEWIVRLLVASWNESLKLWLKAFGVEDQHVTGVGFMKGIVGCFLMDPDLKWNYQVSQKYRIPKKQVFLAYQFLLSWFWFRLMWNRVEPCSWNSDNNDLPELAQPEEDEIQGHLVWVWISWGRKRVMTGGRIASSNIFLRIWYMTLMWMCFAVVVTAVCVCVLITV